MTAAKRESPLVSLIILACFFLIFAGPGSTQAFIKNLVPETWAPLKVTSILAVLYFSFLIWRILIIATQRALGDRWSIVLALTAYVAMPAVLVFTTNYAVLLALAVFWGWGAAGLWQTGPVWLYDVTSPRRRGLWAGLLYTLVFIGLMLGFSFQGKAEAQGRGTLLAFSLVPGVLAVVLSFLLPRRAARAEPLSPAGIRVMLADRRVAILGLFLFMSATSYGLLLGAFRDNVEAAFGPRQVGIALAFYSGARMLVSLVGGHFGDVLARRTVMAAAFVVGSAALAAATLREGVAAFSAAATCLGFLSAVVPVSTTALSADWFPPEKRALALGTAFAWRDAGMVASLLGGQYIVVISGSFKPAFLAFAVFFMAAAALALALPHDKEHTSDE